MPTLPLKFRRWLTIKSLRTKPTPKRLPKRKLHKIKLKRSNSQLNRPLQNSKPPKNKQLLMQPRRQPMPRKPSLTKLLLKSLRMQTTTQTPLHCCKIMRLQAPLALPPRTSIRSTLASTALKAYSLTALKKSKRRSIARSLRTKQMPKPLQKPKLPLIQPRQKLTLLKRKLTKPLLRSPPMRMTALIPRHH